MTARTAATPAIDDKATAMEERIRQRAFEIFVSRGDRPGTAEEDWYQAETEVRNDMERNRPFSPRLKH